MQHSYSILTTASPEKVWSLSTDVKNWKQWNPSLEGAEINGNFDALAEGVMVEKQGQRRMFRVQSCKPLFCYTLQTAFPFARLYSRRMIGYHNRKTIFTTEIWMEGPLSAFWWKLVGKQYLTTLPANMERFRKLAEA
jgi:hypothetical protein